MGSAIGMHKSSCPYGNHCLRCAHMAPRKNAAGLSRDIDLLDHIVAANGSPSSVSELAAQTGRDKSLISRALSTLADAGILDRDASSRGLSLIHI